MLHANAVDFMMKILCICNLNALLSFTKENLYSQFKTKVINCIGAQHCRELFNNRDSLVKLILDCSRYSIIKEKPECHELLNTSADLMYRLHVTRIKKLSLE